MEDTITMSVDTDMVLKTVADLTRLQQQRYAHLNGIYSNHDASLQLVQLLEPKGENNWKGVTDKIDKLIRADYKEQQYDDSLYENFNLGEVYTSADIIRIVGIVRRDVGLPIYLSSLKRNCENDFMRLFIVRTISEDIGCIDHTPGATKQKCVIFGYKPLFRLKPDE